MAERERKRERERGFLRKPLSLSERHIEYYIDGCNIDGGCS